MDGPLGSIGEPVAIEGRLARRIMQVAHYQSGEPQASYRIEPVGRQCVRVGAGYPDSPLTLIEAA